ncbi:MAG: alpha/beta hydrolase [Chloroflexi bacterium]|nr:alpha/beta hydrolase [Chloroflexota bacterium]
MPITSVRDVNLYYEDLGAGEPVLWIHGFSGDHRGWAAQIPVFQDAYRCMVYDQRDSGRSATSRRDYTTADLAEDAVGLLDALDIPRATVVGFSMGGAVAQEFAINHPERVHGLVLVATYTAGDPRGSENLRAWARMRAVFTPEQYHRAISPWVLTYREYLVPGLVEGFLQRALENPYRQSQEAYERQMEAVLAHNAEDRLGRITAPCLVLVGDEDILAPLRFSRTLVSRIPRARLEVIPEVGHALLWVKPDEVNRAIGRFLAGLSGAESS